MGPHKWPEKLLKPLAAVLFAACVALLPSIASADPKDDIAAITREWSAAFAEHDVDRILKLYSRDALLWGTNAKALRTTPAEVRSFFESAFKIPNIRVTFDNQTIRIFGNVAVVAGNYTFFGGGNSAASQTRPARYSFTLIKDGDRWLSVDHNSSQLPGVPTGRAVKT